MSLYLFFSIFHFSTNPAFKPLYKPSIVKRPMNKAFVGYLESVLCFYPEMPMSRGLQACFLLLLVQSPLKGKNDEGL